MKFTTLITRSIALVATTVLTLASSAFAGTIEIQVSGLNLNYSAANDRIVDNGGAAGGNHVAAQADILNAAVFFVDGTPQLPPLMLPAQYGDFFESISATIDPIDLLMNPVEVNPTNAGGDAFGFEWFTLDGGNSVEYFLDLEFDQLTTILTPTGFFITGVANVVGPQNLPYGLAFDTSQPLSIAYQSTNFSTTTMTNGTTVVTALDLSGQLTIRGQMAVPEPATAAILLGSMLGLAVYLRQSWK